MGIDDGENLPIVSDGVGLYGGIEVLPHLLPMVSDRIGRGRGCSHS
jgi:hypothetical protein